MRSEEEVAVVLSLVGRGLNDCAISRATGIPRPTVRMWRIGQVPSRKQMSKAFCVICSGSDTSPLPSGRYSYLLGQYLGDGSISRSRKGVFRLRVFTDSRYPQIIEECAESMCAVMPMNKVRVEKHPHSNMMIISSWSKHWPCLFPQHGPGMKHLRRIALEHWQVSIVQDHPEAFLRGLIHSDGCRVMNRVKKRKYAYPRYMFSNVSTDISRLFTDSCDRLGIAWRQMNPRNVSIARGGSVALMDTFIGPKT
jgi:hypothetical protein